MVLSFALIGSIYALMTHFNAHAFELGNFFSQDSKLHIVQFQNGISAFIEENSFPPKTASLKIIIKESVEQLERKINIL